MSLLQEWRLETMTEVPERMDNPFVSVVVPVYNEKLVLRALYTSVTRVLGSLLLDFELILINDGSTDGSMEELKLMSLADDRVKIVDLSRNFGHQIAVTAGIEYAKGDVVIIMDADLQDPPELIQVFLQKWREGYDVVYAVRQTRHGETRFKVWTAKWFYRLLNRASDVPIPLDTGDFRLINRNVVDILCDMHERNRFLRGLVSWVGLNQIGVPYVRQERLAGETKYPLRKMLKLAIDGITSFSHLPLKWATSLGFYSSGFGFVLMLVILYLKFFTHRTIQGWTSLMVILLFLGGVQLLVLGVMGEYIGRIYDEVRQRPLYIIRKTYNIEKDRRQ